MFSHAPQDFLARVTWFKDNLALGRTEMQLRTTMREQGVDDVTIQTIIDRVQAIQGLAKAPYDPEDEEELHACCSDPRHQHR